MASVSVGRNDPCPCGSGKKYKHCCQGKEPNSAGPAAAGALRSEKTPPGALDALRRAARESFAAERFPEAVAALKEIARLRPDSADDHYNLGVGYQRLGRFVEAASSLRSAVELRPSFHQALAQLALALEYWKVDSEALAAYRKLSRVAGDPRQRLQYLAKAQTLEGKPDEAEATLRRLLVLTPENGAARMALGQALIDQRKFDEAVQELKRAIDTVPGAFQKLAAARRMTEADRPLLERMRAKAGEPGLDGEARTMIEFGLGKAFDDLRDYDEAMRHYDAANALRAKSARFSRGAIAQRYDDIIARYDAETLERAARASERPRRADCALPVFIVGMPRSGTTLTEQIVSSHPAVAAAGELQFWRVRAADLRPAGNGLPAPDSLAKAAEDYFALLRSVGPEALRVTDKAPLNFEALGPIRLALPNARIIHCRRHPVDTCLSIYFTEFASSLGFAFNRGDIAFMYRQYERLMDHWRRVLSPDCFLDLDYEKLVTDREAETRRLLAFIGLDWNDACLAHERNARIVKTASVWQARQPIYTSSVERWRHYEPWLGELRELLPAVDPPQHSPGRNAAIRVAPAAAVEWSGRA